MNGFDAQWESFPDYILGITQEIWEGRGLHTLKDYYHKDVVVRLPSGIMVRWPNSMTARQLSKNITGRLRLSTKSMGPK